MTSPARPRCADPLLGEPVTASAADPVLHQLRAALDERMRALFAHEAGTRAGADPEELHQMRVALRRMRSLLRAARPLLDADWAEELRAELGWLGRALGPVRDADVLLARLRGRAETFDDTGREATETLLDALVADRQAARTVLLATLDSERYHALADRLAAAVTQPLPAAPGAQAPELLDLVGEVYRKLRKDVRNAGDDPPDDVLHKLRIRGKRLRYTGELARIGGGERVGRFVKAVTKLQDVLGEHQDACVARQRVAQLLDGFGDVVDLDVVFVAGRIAEREEISRVAARRAWPAVWRRVSKRASALELP